MDGYWLNLDEFLFKDEKSFIDENLLSDEVFA